MAQKLAAERAAEEAAAAALAAAGDDGDTIKAVPAATVSAADREELEYLKLEKQLRAELGLDKTVEPAA